MKTNASKQNIDNKIKDKGTRKKAKTEDKIFRHYYSIRWKSKQSNSDIRLELVLFIIRGN